MIDPDRKRSPESIDTEEMVKEWSEMTNMDYAKSKVLWEILKEVMMRHMATKFKSVDFGFCVLHPCAYRTNWKNYLLQSMEWMGRLIRHKGKDHRDWIFRSLDLNGRLHSSELLSVRNGLAYITLEVVPKRSWWRFMLHVQRRLLASLGPAKYCAAIGRLVGRLKPRLIESYVSHLSEIAIPCGRLAQGRYFNGRQYLVENRNRGKVRPVPLPVELGPLYYPSDPFEFSQPLDEAGSPPPPSKLLPMSDNEPPVIDLRDDDVQLPPRREGN